MELDVYCYYRYAVCSLSVSSYSQIRHSKGVAKEGPGRGQAVIN